MDDVDVAPVDHFWCSDFQWITRHFSEYLECVLNSKSHPVWWCRASISDLGTCRDCMEQFHVLLDDELLNCSLAEKKRIFEFDTERLATALSESVSHLMQSIQKASFSSDEDSDDGICIMSQDVSVMQSNVRIPLREALSYPRYLHCKDVGRGVVEAISLLVIHDMTMNVKRKVPGVYLLLVHPVIEVQLWAVNKVKSLGLVTLDEYDREIEEVIQWLLSVTKWGLLDTFADTDVPNITVVTPPSEVWDEASPTLLPSHLFSASHPKSYWLGMCMLLKTLEGSIIRTKLSASEKTSLINGVVGVLKSSLPVDEGKEENESYLTDTRLDKSTDPGTQEVLSLCGGGQDELRSTLLPSTAAFWPALQCFITLLERLEGQLWEHCSWSCKEVVTLITKNAHYVEEMRKSMSEGCITVAGRDRTDGELTSGSDTVSCSQLVYEWESVKRSKPKHRTNQRNRRTCEEVFQWLVPFVQSVVKHNSLPNSKKLDIFADLLSHLLCLYKEGVRESGNDSDSFLDVYKLCNFSAKVLAYNFRIALILQQANLLSPVSSAHIHTTLDLAAMVVIGSANSAVLESPKMPFSTDQPTCTSSYPECAVPACLLLSALLTEHEQCSNIVQMLGSLCGKILAVSSHSVFAGYLTPRQLVVSSPRLSQTCGFASPVLEGVDSVPKLCSLGLKGLLARLHSTLKLKEPTLDFNNLSYGVKPTPTPNNVSGANVTKRPLEVVQETLLLSSPHSNTGEVTGKPQLEDSYGCLSMTSTYALHFGGESPSLMSSGEEHECRRGSEGTQSTDDTEVISGSDGEVSGCAQGSPVLFSDTDSLHSTGAGLGNDVLDTEDPLQVTRREIPKSLTTEYERPTTANRMCFRISRPPPTATSTLVTTKVAITTTSRSTSAPSCSISLGPISKTVAVTSNSVTAISSSSLGTVVSTRSLATATQTGNLATATTSGRLTTATPTGLLATATPTGLLATATPTGLLTTATPTGLLTTATPTGLLTTATPTGLLTTATPTGLLATATPTCSLITSTEADSVVKPKSIPMPVITGDSRSVALTRKISTLVHHSMKDLTPSKPKRRRILWSSESDDSDFEFSSVSPLKRKPVTQRKDTKIPYANEVSVDNNVTVLKKTPLKSLQREMQTKLLERDLVIRRSELLSRIKSEEEEVVLRHLTREEMLRATPLRKDVPLYPTLVPSYRYLCPPSTSSRSKRVTKRPRRGSTVDSDDSLKEDELENLVKKFKDKKYKDRVLFMPHKNWPSTRKAKIRSTTSNLSLKKKTRRLSQTSKLQLAAEFLEESSDGTTDTLSPHQSGSDDYDSDFSLPKVKTSFSSLGDSSKKGVERFGGRKSMSKIAEKLKSPAQPQSPFFKLLPEAQSSTSKWSTFLSCSSRLTSEHNLTLSKTDPPERDILSFIDPITIESIEGGDPQDRSVQGIECLDEELNDLKDDLSNFDNFDDDDVSMDTNTPRQNKATPSKKSTLGEVYTWKKNTDERLSHKAHQVEHSPLSSSVKVGGVACAESSTPTSIANKTVSSSLLSTRMSRPSSSSVEENDCHSVLLSTTTSRTTSSHAAKSLNTLRTAPLTTFSGDTWAPLPTTGSCVATKRPAPGIPLLTDSSSMSSSLRGSSQVAPDKSTPQPCLTLSVSKLDLDLQSKGKHITSTLSGDAVQKDTRLHIGVERTQSRSSNSRSGSRDICDQPSLRDGDEDKPLPSINDVRTSPQTSNDGWMKRKRRSVSLHLPSVKFSASGWSSEVIQRPSKSSKSRRMAKEPEIHSTHVTKQVAQFSKAKTIDDEEDISCTIHKTNSVSIDSNPSKSSTIPKQDIIAHTTSSSKSAKFTDGNRLQGSGVKRSPPPPLDWSSSDSSSNNKMASEEPEIHSTHVTKQVAQFSKTKAIDEEEDISCRIHKTNSVSIDSNPSKSSTILKQDIIAHTKSSSKSAIFTDGNRLRGSGVKRSPPPPLDWSSSDSSSNDEMSSKASNALSHLLKDKQLLSREIPEKQSGTEQQTVLPKIPKKARKASDPSKPPPVVSGAPFSRPRAAVFSENAPLPTTSKKARTNDKPPSNTFKFEAILDAMKETRNDSSRPLPSDKQQQQQQQQQQQSEQRSRSVLSSSAPVDLTPRPLHTQEELLAMLLSWNADMFLSPPQSVDGKIIKPSPESVGISVHSLKNVPLSFASVSGYFSTYAPLFLFELWETVYSEVHMPATKPPPFACKIEGISNNDGPLKDVRCQGSLSPSAVRDYAYPLERHLVVVHIYEPGSACGGGDVDSWRVFGLVDKAKPGNVAGGTLLNVTMKVHSDTLSYLREGAQLKVTVVMGMTVYLRQWSGLINVHKSKVAKQLLLPLGGRYFEGNVLKGLEDTDGKKRTHLLNGKVYNFSQHSAIQMAVRCACEPYTNPRINLLQGPPGTGKTRTIVGIIHHFFDSYKKHGTKMSSKRQCIPGVGDAREDKPHLLVCAPSNAGVDEILNRLLGEGLVEGTPQWKKRNEQVSTGVLKPRNSNAPENKMSVINTKGLSVVRVGRMSKIHNSVLPLSLDQLAEKKITEELVKKNKEEKALEQKLAALTKEADSDRDSEHANKVKKLQWQLNALKKTRTTNRFQDSIMRRKILQRADIVFCTLSGSASTDMEGCFLGNPLHFTCVIVDEAAQCCELDILVPLRYGSSKLVLVGDPLQLPATIKSQQAKSLGYDQSLFERIYKHFDKELGNESPVRMLQLQYRMVEEICHFPSQHFYRGELHSAQDVGKRGRPGLCPFLVFDVQGGKEESRDRSSLCNTTECSMVSELCRVVCREVRENRIGVITPYKAQEKLLKQKLATLSQIEVGTVDSFQGREKDVIILTCVRAKAFDGSIGFLSDQKRMNVALTRAKFGLYIVCHKNTLTVNPTWRELIKHAETRNAFVTVPTGKSFHIYSTKILRPKQATATVSAPSCVEPSRSKTNSDPSASCKKDTHDRVVGVANSYSVCHPNSQEHRPNKPTTTEDGSCSHFEDGNHRNTEAVEINCQSKSAKEDDFHSREVVDNTGLSRGKGDNTGQSRGKGDNTGQSRGKGDNTGQSRGKGDNTGQSRGKGDNTGQSRGKGDNTGQSRGKGDNTGQSRGKGDNTGQSRGKEDNTGQSRGKGDNTGQSKGKGDNTGLSRGKGDNTGQSGGKGDNTGQSGGKGDNIGQSGGKGDNIGQSRGKGDNDGQPRGKGVQEGPFREKGDKEGQSRGEVYNKGHSSGKWGRDHIHDEMQSSKSNVDFARPTSEVEVRNAMGTSRISSRPTDSRPSTGELGLATNHLSNSHGPTQHKKQPLLSDPRRKTIPRSAQSGGAYANQHSDCNSHTHHTRWENPSTTPLPALSTRPSQYSHSTHTPLPPVGMPSPFVQQYSEMSRHPIPAYSPSDKLWPRQPGQLSNLGFNPGRRDRVSYANYGRNVPIQRPHFHIEQPARIPRKRPPSTREIVLRGIHRKR